MSIYKPFPTFIPRPVIVVCVSLFIIFWLTGMTTALSGALCTNPDKPAEKRLRGCNIAIPLGHLIPGDGHKRGSVYLERAILRANRGETELARADMAEALDRTTYGEPHRAIQMWGDSVRQTQETMRDRHKGPRPYRRDPGYWVANLFERMAAEPQGTPANLVWAGVVMKAERTEVSTLRVPYSPSSTGGRIAGN